MFTVLSYEHQIIGDKLVKIKNFREFESFDAAMLEVLRCQQFGHYPIVGKFQLEGISGRFYPEPHQEEEKPRLTAGEKTVSRTHARNRAKKYAKRTRQQKRISH